MVDQAEREPTMEEIVVALRETRKGAGPAAPFAVVGGRHGGSQVPGAAADAQSRTAGSTVADLRDSEIERLLADNARLNERVMFLLKVMDREQARHAPSAAEHAAAETDPGAIVHALRVALQAELSPVLQVLLRVLERTEPTARQPAWPAAPQDDDGIIDLDAQRA